MYFLWQFFLTTTVIFIFNSKTVSGFNCEGELNEKDFTGQFDKDVKILPNDENMPKWSGVTTITYFNYVQSLVDSKEPKPENIINDFCKDYYDVWPKETDLTQLCRNDLNKDGFIGEFDNDVKNVKQIEEAIAEKVEELAKAAKEKKDEENEAAEEETVNPNIFTEIFIHAFRFLYRYNYIEEAKSLNLIAYLCDGEIKKLASTEFKESTASKDSTASTSASTSEDGHD